MGSIAQGGQLLAHGCSSGGREQVRKLEIPPGRWTKTRRNDDVGQGRMAGTAIKLHQIHDLQPGV